MTGRALQLLLTLCVMSFFVYMLIGLMPGDPVDMMLAGNPTMTPEDAARLRAIYGLDRPLVERYWHWLTALLGGDAGYSRLFGLPVFDVIWPRILNTAILMGMGLVVTLCVAIPLGVFAARHPANAADRFIAAFSLCGMSMPAFWLALLLISLFVVKLGLLPATASLDNPASLILPIAAVTLGGLAAYIRHARSAMIDALKAPHIRTAYAKGCSEGRVVWRHAFRNAAAPLVTLAMLDLGTMLGGAVTVETIFAYPGMGKLMFDAVMGNDYNLAMVGFLLLAACVVLGNFMADAAYALLDPRAKKAAA